ncbi:MAG: SBBP repeat-containing protein [Proteobacteria bacterium]|nr:SBBP repeat-containing protein [Pseudomonadota bacterium]
MQRRVVRLLLASAVLAVGVSVGMSVAAAGVQDARHDATLRARIGHPALPLLFEAAGGNRVAPAALMSLGSATRVAVTRDAIHVALPMIRGLGVAEHPHGVEPSGAVTLRFVGAAAEAYLRGLDPQPARINYLRTSDPSGNRVDVPVFGRAGIGEVYPAIDAVVYGDGSVIEYDFVVGPRGDPASIRMRVEGASSITLDAAGDAMLTTPRGILRLRHPVAWQDGDHGRSEVEAAFALRAQREIVFAIGDYDHARPLVIDPVIAYATYAGGSALDVATAIAVDASGSVYITGLTRSTDFPLKTPIDASVNAEADSDAFVVKLAPDGKSLVYATFLGGPVGLETATGIAVDKTGSVYVGGITDADDFPVTAGAYQKGTAGGGSFVAKLNAAGNALVYSTYVAGVVANALAVDDSGNAYVAGEVTGAFATTPGALQETGPAYPKRASFVLKLGPTGSSASYATFLAGPGEGGANAIAVDASGHAYVGGWTSGTFPLVRPLQPGSGGSRDGYVSVLDPSGSRLVSSTLIGGAYDDTVNALALDREGLVYVAGETYSGNFPSVNGFQPKKSGVMLLNSTLGNAFVAKLDLSAGRVVWSSFLGGETCFCMTRGNGNPYPGDAAYGLAVDSEGHAYVTGITRTWTFPLIDSTSLPNPRNGEESGFVAKVSAAGTTLLFSTFVRTGAPLYSWTGGSPDASAKAVAIDGTGAAYVLGNSASGTDFTASAGTFQSGNPGGLTPVVVKFPPPSHHLAIASSNLDGDAATPVTLSAAVDGLPVAGPVEFLSGALVLGSATLAANRASITMTLTPGIHVVSARMSTPEGQIDGGPLLQIVDQPLSCAP